MGKTNPKFVARMRRKLRIRKKISGTGSRPRLSVFRSSKYIYAQLIDDVHGKTILSISELSVENKEQFAEMKKKEKAYALGKIVATQCLEKGIEEIVFDRNGFIFHGRVKALADGARKGGLKF